MKKLLLIVLSGIVICGCSGGKDNTPTYTPGDGDYMGGFNDYKKEYNINKDGLEIDYMSTGIDTTTVYFNGRIDGKLWVGGYEKGSKKEILDWADNVRLDTVVNYNKGYGIYENFKVYRYNISFPYKYENAYCFILNGGGSDNSFSDLYFINNNNLTKKHRSVGSYNSEAFRYIFSWFEGVMVENKKEELVCFNMQGDSLFVVQDRSIYYYVESNSCPISYEECIRLIYNYSGFNGFYFERLNLKTKEIIWEEKIMPLTDIPENARINGHTISKSGNEWTYVFNHTLYSGEKGTTTILLNIDSGELEEI